MENDLSDMWISQQLGEFITLQRGFDITKKEQRPGPYWVISSSGPSSFHDEARVPGPGVVIGRKGSLGGVYFSDSDFWPHDTTLWVKDFKGNDPVFTYYYLKTLGLERFDVGAANPTLNRNHLHLLPVSAPPPSMQRKIAAVLTAYDELIENNLRRIAILEEMAQAVYRDWFVNFRFPGHEEVALADSSLGLIPEGWDVAIVSDAVDLNPRVRLSRDTELRFVPMRSLVEGSMVVAGYETRFGPSGSQFSNGDTLLARITPSLENGKTGFVQFLSEGEIACGSTEFIVMRPLTLNPEFVYLLARTDDFRGVAIKSMVGASGRQRVQEPSIAGYPFPHPDPLTLERFHDVISPTFRMVQNLVDQNTNLRATRDLLLPRLVSGEIDVSHLDIATEWLAS